MRRSILVLALIFATSSSAHSRNFCFNSTSPPNPAPPNNPDILVVAQNFKVPKKGTCKTINGFELGSISSNPPIVPRPVSGTACLNAAGTLLRAGFTLHEVYDSVVDNSSAVHAAIAVGMDLPFPALTNGWAQVRLADGDDVVRQDALAGPCRVTFP